MAVSIPATATVAIANVKSADIAAVAAGSLFSEHQIQHQQGCDQSGGEHAPRILLAIGDDLRTPAPGQQLLHGVCC